jgi:hypothetical protein
MQTPVLVEEPHEAEKAAAKRTARTRLVALVVALVLVAIAGVVVVAVRVNEAREFDAAAFRAAAASGDDGTLERQSDNAVRARVLIGMPAARVKATLGAPHRVEQGRYVWHVGMINDTLWPGDGGSFVVGFDAAGRVRSAEVTQYD